MILEILRKLTYFVECVVSSLPSGNENLVTMVKIAQK